MERGFARPGADLGADPGADFIFEKRGILGGLIIIRIRSSGDIAVILLERKLNVG